MLLLYGGLGSGLCLFLPNLKHPKVYRRNEAELSIHLCRSRRQDRDERRETRGLLTEKHTSIRDHVLPFFWSFARTRSEFLFSRMIAHELAAKIKTYMASLSLLNIYLQLHKQT